MNKKNQTFIVIDMQNGYLNLKNEDLRKSIEKLKIRATKSITYAINLSMKYIEWTIVSLSYMYFIISWVIVWISYTNFWYVKK